MPSNINPNCLEPSLVLKRCRVNNHGCWNWTGSIASTGYGHISIKSKTFLAHRASYLIFNGKITDGQFVCHKCDNKKCVNPAHLFLGYQRDNITDAVIKKRNPFGSNHGMAKINESTVKSIRDLLAIGDLSQKSIAIKFGISRSTVTLINSRKIWNKC